VPSQSESDLSQDFQVDYNALGISDAVGQPLELPSRFHSTEKLNTQVPDNPRNGGDTQSLQDLELGGQFDFVLDSSRHSNSDEYVLQTQLTSANGVLGNSPSRGGVNELASRDLQHTPYSPNESISQANSDVLNWGSLSGPPTTTSNEMDLESLGFQPPWTESLASMESSQTGWMGDIFPTPMETSNSFDLLGSFGIPRNSPNPSQITGSRPFSPTTFSTVSWKPPLSFSSTSNRNSLSLIDSSVTSTSGPRVPLETPLNREVSSHKRKSPASQRPPRRAIEKESPATCPFHQMGTDDDLIRTMSGYPQTMLKRGQYPPFVHHRIYRCAEGDVLEPLANAFCCVSAFNAALPSSETFVQSLMNAERDRLIKSFVSIKY
jgi:hypothetical protein